MSHPLSSVCTVDRIGAPSGQFPRIARLVASAPVIFSRHLVHRGGNRDRRDEGHVERKHRIEGGRKARRVAEAQLLKGDLQGLSEGLQVAGLGRDVAPQPPRAALHGAACQLKRRQHTGMSLGTWEKTGSIVVSASKTWPVSTPESRC
jgi:hypothetical protein